jgi:hypothetical protein
VDAAEKVGERAALGEEPGHSVVAGLTLPYSSGPVEGTVNRIKMLKRQMFGRAKLPLLRKRILLSKRSVTATTRPATEPQFRRRRQPPA